MPVSKGGQNPKICAQTRKSTTRNRNRPVSYLKAGTQNHTGPRNASPRPEPDSSII